MGIEGMHVGGERKITIPAPMAYGKKAQPGIPANSTLVFGEFCGDAKSSIEADKVQRSSCSPLASKLVKAPTIIRLGCPSFVVLYEGGVCSTLIKITVVTMSMTDYSWFAVSAHSVMCEEPSMYTSARYGWSPRSACMLTMSHAVSHTCGTAAARLHIVPVVHMAGSMPCPTNSVLGPLDVCICSATCGGQTLWAI